MKSNPLAKINNRISPNLAKWEKLRSGLESPLGE
jgi:hypothetical protein